MKSLTVYGVWMKIHLSQELILALKKQNDSIPNRIILKETATKLIHAHHQVSLDDILCQHLSSS